MQISSLHTVAILSALSFICSETFSAESRDEYFVFAANRASESVDKINDVFVASYNNDRYEIVPVPVFTFDSLSIRENIDSDLVVVSIKKLSHNSIKDGITHFVIVRSDNSSKPISKSSIVSVAKVYQPEAIKDSLVVKASIFNNR